MDDFSQSVLKKSEHLFLKIEKKRNLIALHEMMMNKKGQKKYTVIYNMQGVINHCLQYGNYWRACRYILFTERLLDDFEKNEHMLKNKVTNYFLGR